MSHFRPMYRCPEHGDTSDPRNVGNVAMCPIALCPRSLNLVGAVNVDPRDAEIASLRSEVERLTQERDAARTQAESGGLERYYLCYGWGQKRREYSAQIHRLHLCIEAVKKDRLAVRADLETRLGAAESTAAELARVAKAAAKLRTQVSYAARTAPPKAIVDGFDVALAALSPAARKLVEEGK